MEPPAATFIQGVGDEVTVVAGVVVLVLALVLAWLSTYVADSSNQLLGTIVAAGDAAVIRLGHVERYVGAAGAAEALDPPRGTENQEEKTEYVEGFNLSPCFAEGSLQKEQGGANFKIMSLKGETACGGSAVAVPRAGTLIDFTMGGGFPPAPGHFRCVPEPHLCHLRPLPSFRSKYFPGQESQMKFIYRGQLLQDQGRTLRSLHITDNCVIHCHRSRSAAAALPDASTAAPDASSLSLSTGNLMVPAVMVVLAVVWYLRLNYRQLFTAPATVSLIGVTILFSFLAFGMYGQ
ncbi:TMUB2 protein, partial [Ciconia maguari]|nr:TMUB2 protein [Ciconia maguari]